MRIALRLRNAALLAVASLGFATGVQAAPVAYEFTTGPVFAVSGFLGPNQAAFDALSGLSVTGTFMYDSAVLQSGSTNGPIVFGQSDYAGALTNFSASVGSSTVSAPSGIGSVANEGYTNPTFPAPSDFLQLGLVQPVTGFALPTANLRLVGTRMFWIESSVLTTGFVTPDFLNDNNLPAAPPTFQGRLALDFLPIDAAPGDFSGFTAAFFDDLRVTAVPVDLPEPGTLTLFAFAAAALLIAVARQRRLARK